MLNRKLHNFRSIFLGKLRKSITQPNLKLKINVVKMRLFCRFSNILRLITLSPTLKSSLVALFKVEFSLEKPGLGILGILLLVKSSLVKLELSLENPGLGILERPPESVPMPELEEVEAAEVGLGR